MIYVEHGPDGGAALFEGAQRLIRADRAEEVLPALAALDAARADGFWVAGWMGYEAGYALEPRLLSLMPKGAGPLLRFGVFEGPGDAAGALARQRPERAVLSELVPMVSRGGYDEAFVKVQGYIAAGDCYQINLTFPMEGRLLGGSAWDLMGALAARQRVGEGAFCDFGEGPVIVSRSPELFFAVDGAGQITARPMKGTAPRGANAAEDAALAGALQASEKDRAENLMIVDLLRNDIGRLSRVGSVRVPELFAVERYATVHQMVSRVVGQLVEGASMAGLMAALFPCGSVTGAPKIRAMEIIREVEGFARGAYCGAVGWMAPDGRAHFNVAIRTLRIEGDLVTLNVGGGVVADSRADSEWEEALWKARFATGLSSRG
ncbi:aminodeoxychorismate synthase component I [Neogemmobacter tilapiae]|uniref:Aminodeoxychorismate synthase, component I n=1 Tax=Neogemmobacter tilapiae TaxID=875041 RepID=A0A918U0K3_9RHOB|nr:aminodeoxychorismate synthase component I [Gemmobacter tilapiae]GHC64979.1 aminodeoxychorismate synthase, component I [Gemmobacter tilapiae]